VYVVLNICDTNESLQNIWNKKWPIKLRAKPSRPPDTAIYIRVHKNITKADVFWVMTPCGVMVGYQHFGGLFTLKIKAQSIATLDGITLQKTSTWNTATVKASDLASRTWRCFEKNLWRYKMDLAGSDHVQLTMQWSFRPCNRAPFNRWLYPNSSWQK
jgi:hypothetical protein